MCLIVFAWKTAADYPLLVAANRDEWRARPTAAASWWNDVPAMLAGRDLEAGGTWLGVTRSGRFAALTNFRDPTDRKSGAPSRGSLVRDYLAGNQSPHEYLTALRAKAQRFQGFNLLVGTRDELWYFGSRIDELLPIPPGVHALSNHTLNEPWPKVLKAKSALEAALQPELPWKARQSSCFFLLSNGERAEDEQLPDTGVGLEWERQLSSILISGVQYGTRSSTVLAFTAKGEVEFEERSLDSAGGVARVAAYSFALS